MIRESRLYQLRPDEGDIVSVGDLRAFVKLLDKAKVSDDVAFNLFRGVVEVDQP